MSDELRELIERFLVKHGRPGKLKLAMACECSERTLGRWIEEGPPSEHEAYLLAKAAGASETKAIALARRAFRAKETA